jgi:uncharacterized protein YcbK (DUF882 family)
VLTLGWATSFVIALATGGIALTASSPLAGEPEPPPPGTLRADGVAQKSADADVEGDGDELLATLVQTHTDERVALGRERPAQERFDALLADRTTGSQHPLDPHLLDLLRTLAARHRTDAGPARIELVSGYRSPKLNEMLRKKGHHVASHSQHSLGHAVDFRIVEGDEASGVDPRVLKKEIRALGWEGGVGTYPGSGDWFVHADVGPTRDWET